MAMGRTPKHDIAGKIVTRFRPAPKHDIVGKIATRFNNLKRRNPPKKGGDGEITSADPKPKPRPLIGGSTVEIE